MGQHLKISLCTFHASTGVTVDSINTHSQLTTGVAAALVNVDLTVAPSKAQRTHADVIHTRQLLHAILLGMLECRKHVCKAQELSNSHCL